MTEARVVQAYFGSPLVQAAKKVYQQDRTGMPGEGDQLVHDPALTKGPAMPAQNTMDPEVRAQKLLAFAKQIQKERGWDFFKAWIQASAEHPELIDSDADGGPSRPVKVPETNVLPDSGENAVTASYKDIGMARFR
jgi:hypothetical protein